MPEKRKQKIKKRLATVEARQISESKKVDNQITRIDNRADHQEKVMKDIAIMD